MRKIDLSAFQTATNFTTRDINRRIVLDLIRTQQPISRADIARRSGLQRSTITQIADQLIAQNWIEEGEAGRNIRGRKSRLLQLNLERAGILGINVRPLQTAIAQADLNGRFHAQESFLTPRDPERFVRELTRRVRAFLAPRPGIRWEGIGISVPGAVDQRTQRIIFSPNLGWRDLDLSRELKQVTGLGVTVENASNACALAEIWFGRAAPVRNLITVTVAEGIGTGIILNGELVHGASGAGGEFGHVTLVEDGLPCPCGNRGCWERYSSNSAALDWHHQLEHKRQAIPEAMHGLSFPELMQRAAEGEPSAAAALDRAAHYLGVGIAMLVTGFAPERVVVIGEITQAWPRVSAIIQEIVRRRCGMYQAVELLAANEADQPRLRGAIAMVLQHYFAAPRIA